MKTPITHCALGWDLHPCCGYADGQIMPSKTIDIIINYEYYKHSHDLNAWPIDPDTCLPLKTQEEIDMILGKNARLEYDYKQHMFVVYKRVYVFFWRETFRSNSYNQCLEIARNGF